jgi:hypothetical protein
MNWLAILCAGAAYWVLGFVWYSLLFGKVWASELVGYRGERSAPSGAGMVGKMIVTFIANVVTSGAIAYLLRRGAPIVDLTHALKLGVYVAIGFSIMTLTISKVWEAKPTKIWMIDSSFHLIGCVIAATILVSWR